MSTREADSDIFDLEPAQPATLHAPTAVPRIIHQTWRDAAIPEQFAGYVASVRRHHPDWAYRLWTDADLAALVAERFPDLRTMFEAYPKPIMRADLGRYLVLKAFGGIYADLDAEALRSWDELLASDRPVFSEEPESHAQLEFVRSRGFTRIVSNALIASPPAHPFWDFLIAMLRRCRSAFNPLDATGPFVLTATIDQADPALRPRLLPASATSPIDKFGKPAPQAGARPLAQHHWIGTWWRKTLPAAPMEVGARLVVRRSLGGKLAARWRGRVAVSRLRAALRAAKALPRASAGPDGTVLIAIPVRDAATTLEPFFASLLALDVPKHRLSLGILEGDSVDDSYASVAAFARAHGHLYRRVTLRKQDAGFPRLERRWEPQHQRARRAHLARVRNTLLRAALRDEDWVLWLDADIVRFPPDLLTRLLATQARVAQANCVKVPGGPSFDTNGWVVQRAQSEEEMRRYMIDGLYQPPLSHQRLYLSDLRYRERVALASVGGTSLLVDAALHRAGIGFPETPYRNMIETEAFGALLHDHGVEIAGLPNLEIIHANA